MQQAIVFILNLIGYALLSMAAVNLFMMQTSFFLSGKIDFNKLRAFVQLALTEAVTAAVCLWAAQL